MARVCVQSLCASIFQLINFIFTHLFLNVLSDGNAAGCSSEVLTRQMGLKGEVSQCQRQDFNSNLRDPFSFYYSWKVRIISAKSAEHTWSPTVLLIQYKKSILTVRPAQRQTGTIFQTGKTDSCLFFIRLLMDSNWQPHFGNKTSSVLPSSVNATEELYGRLEGDLRRILGRCWNGFLKPRA